MTPEFLILKKNMNDFLNKKITGDQIVYMIDIFVSNDHVYALSKDLCEKILDLQDKVAFYTSDPVARTEHVLYFDDDKLRVLIMQFLQ